MPFHITAAVYLQGCGTERQMWKVQLLNQCTHNCTLLEYFCIVLFSLSTPLRF